MNIKTQIKNQKGNILWSFLILSALIIWLIGYPASLKAMAETIGIKSVQKETPIQKVEAKEEVKPIVYDKEWALREWEKIGQRDNALIVFQCESHWDMNKWNINTNKTIDAGAYMFNSVHFKSGRLTINEATDWKKGTEKAIELYKEQGWTPWVCARLEGIN
jgi:hypothetical protein